jgi:hypothetical protein
MNLLFLALQKAGRISWRLCTPSCEISTEDSSLRLKAFPHLSNMSLLEARDYVLWKAPGQPWAGQVLWASRRTRSLWPPLHSRTPVRLTSFLSKSLLWPGGFMLWGPLSSPLSQWLLAFTFVAPLAFPPACPCCPPPSCWWPSLICPVSKSRHPLSGGAGLACLQNESAALQDS